MSARVASPRKGERMGRLPRLSARAGEPVPRTRMAASFDNAHTNRMVSSRTQLSPRGIGERRMTARRAADESPTRSKWCPWPRRQLGQNKGFEENLGGSPGPHCLVLSRCNPPGFSKAQMRKGGPEAALLVPLWRLGSRGEMLLLLKLAFVEVQLSLIGEPDVVCRFRAELAHVISPISVDHSGIAMTADGHDPAVRDASNDEHANPRLTEAVQRVTFRAEWMRLPDLLQGSVHPVLQ
jgi:hypothetical protein